MTNAPSGTGENLPPMPSPWPASEIPEFGPRKVRFSRATRSMLRFWRGLSIATVVIGTPIVWQRSTHLNRFVQEGQVVTGRVVDHRYSQGENSTYWLEIEYPAGRTWLSRSVSVSESFFNGSRDGDPITVTILKSEPWTYTLGTVAPTDVQEAQFHGSALVLLISGAFTLIGFSARNKANEQLAKLRDWRALPAQVTRSTLDATSEQPNARTVRYRVRMPNGEVREKILFTGLTPVPDPAGLLTGGASIPDVGGFFTVLHEPKTKQSVFPLFEFAGVELVPEDPPAAASEGSRSPIDHSTDDRPLSQRA